MHSFPCVLVIPQHSGVSTPKTCCSPHACTATRLHGALPARFHPSVSHGSGRAHARAAPRAQLTTEARDNLKFLATLERHLGTLEAGELRAVLDAIPPLLNGLRLVRPSTQSQAGCVSGQRAMRAARQSRRRSWRAEQAAMLAEESVKLSFVMCGALATKTLSFCGCPAFP